MYRSNLSLTSAVCGVCGYRYAPTALHPGKSPGANRIGGWVDPRAGLDEYGRSCYHRG